MKPTHLPRTLSTFTVLTFLTGVLLMTACSPSPDPSPVGRTPATSVAIGFELVENHVGDGDRFAAALTLENRGPGTLENRGWELYFNLARILIAESLPAEVQLTHVNGDFYRLTPGDAFAPLAPGESRRIPFEGRNYLSRVSDAPAGFYFVFRDEEGRAAAPVAVTEVTVAPFTRPEQTQRIADDRLEVPTPASRYAENLELVRLAPEEVVPILPTPVSLKPGAGTVTVDASWTIRPGAGLDREAAALAAALEPFLGASPATVEGEAAPKTITLAVGEVTVAGTPRGPGDEAYRLTIDAGRPAIEIVGSDPAGVFYGIQSLRALVPVDAAGGFEIAEMVVGDAPRFAYRGMHLDVARNFQTRETVEKLLDLMAFYKLNRFHFHLTDDEGWRLAIAGLPELVEVGGRRGHTDDERDHLVPSFGSGPDPDDSHGSGHYSRADFIALLRHARDRHIEVIPEFDLPGHARSAIKAMAARHARLAAEGRGEEAEEFLLTDPGDRSEYRSVQGWTDNVIDVCRESTYRFFEALVADVVAMYAEAEAPLTAFHVGGDEVPAGVWEKSPACAAWLADHPEAEGMEGLFDHFLRRAADIVDRHGLVTAGWEEITLHEEERQGGTLKVPNPAFLPAARDGRGFRPYVWNNVWGWGAEDIGYRLANAGYRVVLSNATRLYFDLAYNKDPAEPGLEWAGLVDTRRPWEMIPFDLYKNARANRFGHPIDPATLAGRVRLTAAGRGNVLGIQGQLWSENAKGRQVAEYLAFPKLLGLAERAWAASPTWAETGDPAVGERLLATAWNEFANRLGQRELPRLDRLAGGVGYRLPLPGAVIEGGKLRANVAFPGLEIRYTTDGGEPTADSALYQGPVAVDGSVRLKSFDTRGRGSRTAVVGME